MPCCAAKIASCISVPSLSPLGAAEWVKPAASLSRQPWSAQTALVPSMNALNGADTLPMYVGQPRTIASAVARIACVRAASSLTDRQCTTVPSTSTAPLATASASDFVRPVAEW
jgi:hypothetical protein